jgi:hypothetical protein
VLDCGLDGLQEIANHHDAVICKNTGDISMKTTNAERVRRYRQKHPLRYEFYPAPDVLDIIRHHLGTKGERCIAGILDGLIRAGHRHITGNAGRG